MCIFKKGNVEGYVIKRAVFIDFTALEKVGFFTLREKKTIAHHQSRNIYKNNSSIFNLCHGILLKHVTSIPVLESYCFIGG